jgi:hypothetical protein
MSDTIAPVGNDKWEVFLYFLGEWTGIGTGKPGNSEVERSYRLTLSDQFVEIRSRSINDPQLFGALVTGFICHRSKRTATPANPHLRYTGYRDAPSWESISPNVLPAR